MIKTIDQINDPPGLPTITYRHISALGLFLAAIIALTISGRGIPEKVANLYLLDLPAHLYFVPHHTFLLYILTPVIFLASLILFLTPGILIILAIGKVRRVTDLAIRAFGLSLVSYASLITILKYLAPGKPDPFSFVLLMSAFNLVAWGILAVRVWQGKTLSWPFSDRQERRRALWLLIIPLIGLLLLFPVIFWQDMLDDGFEMLELGRSLTAYTTPHFPYTYEIIGINMGMLPMAYPVHWFISLFGPLEAAARLPLLLYLPILFSILVELIEWRSSRPLGIAEEALLVLALGIYTVTMSYNGSYNLYSADIAAPAAIETMTVLTIAATIMFLWKEQAVWFGFFAILSYLCRPTGLMFVGLDAAALFFTLPELRRRWLPIIAVTIGLSIGIGLFYDRVYIPYILGLKVIYTPRVVLMRSIYLRFFDFMRLNFIIFPSGILPFISLLLLPLQDKYAKFITFVTLSYFIFFFFQGYVALHHFAPAMVLPLVVFWRIFLQAELRFRKPLLAAIFLSCVVALWLSLPRGFEINHTTREIGYKTLLQIGDYETDYRSQVTREYLLLDLFPPAWKVADPSKELINEPLPIINYATRPKPTGQQINYIIQPIDQSAPPGFTYVSSDEVASLFVRDLKEWNADRYQSLNTNYRSPLYDIPPEILFSPIYYPGEPKDIDGQVVIDVYQLARDKLSALKAALLRNSQ